MKDSISNYDGNIEELIKKYHNAIITTIIPTNEYGNFSIILEESIKYVKEKHNDLSVDEKAYILQLIKMLYEDNNYQNIEDIIEKYVKFHKKEYDKYSENTISSSDYDKNIAFIYFFIKNL